MNIFSRLKNFLSKCYYELKNNVTWIDIYELQSYCIVVIIFLISICAIVLMSDFTIKYLLNYLYR